MNLKIEDLIESLERIGDGVVVFDKEFNYLYVNSAGSKLLGRSAQDLIGKNYKIEYPEALYTPFGKAYLKALETNEFQYIEENYLPWDKWFSNRIFPSENGITILFQEITERKKNEFFLKKSESFVKDILEALPMGILVLDRNSKKFIFANNIMCEMLGYTKQEIFQLTPLDIHPKEVEERVKTIFKGKFENIDLTKDIDVIKKDRTVFPVDITAIDFILDGMQCVCGVFVDITQIKITNEKINEQLRELQRWHEATLGREKRIIELKKEVNELLLILEKPIRYPSVNP